MCIVLKKEREKEREREIVGRLHGKRRSSRIPGQPCAVLPSPESFFPSSRTITRQIQSNAGLEPNPGFIEISGNIIFGGSRREREGAPVRGRTELA